MAMIDPGSAKDQPAVVKAAAWPCRLPPPPWRFRPARANRRCLPQYRPTSRRPTTTKRYLLLTAMMTAAVSVAGCSTVSKLNPSTRRKPTRPWPLQGQRISVIAFDQKVEQAEALKGVDFFLPEPAVQADWPLPGGNAEQSVEHVAAAANFDIAWRHGFGQKANRRYHVTAPPVAADGKIFVMDGEATVVAMDARSGSTIWRKDLRPAKAPGKKRGFFGIGGATADRTGFGGGVAYANGKLYVSSGFRFVAQLDAATGAEAWRQQTSTPVHAAPTVADGRVFVISTDNELLTYNAADGAPGWTYQALIEPARILGATSPAVSGDTVVAGFASGELAALRTSNGNDLWSEALSRPAAPTPCPRSATSPAVRWCSRATSSPSATRASSPPPTCARARPAGACRSPPSPAPGPPATWSSWSTRPAR